MTKKEEKWIKEFDEKFVGQKSGFGDWLTPDSGVIIKQFISSLLTNQKKKWIRMLFCNCRGRSLEEAQKGYRGICHTCKKFIDDEVLTY